MCQCSTCDVIYNAEVKECRKGFPIHIKVISNKKSNHSLLHFKSRCGGAQRSQIAQEIIREGIDQVKNNNELLNFINYECKF